jgi:dihydrofolate reductase
MMRRIRFIAAVSLDGFIAVQNGEADWIVPDPEMDFTSLAAQFETLLVGRRRLK